MKCLGPAQNKRIISANAVTSSSRECAQLKIIQINVNVSHENSEAISLQMTIIKCEIASRNEKRKNSKCAF